MLNLRRLKNIREDHDLSQVQMSKILNVSRSRYSLWELGINIIPLDYLYKFANYFNYSIDYVLGNSNNKYKKRKINLNIKNLGNNIKKNRIKNNISQENLAKLLGVSQPCIVRYEKGLIEISTYNLYQLSHYLQIPIDDLLSEEEKITI